MVKKIPLPKQETHEIRIQFLDWEDQWQPTPIFLPGKSHGQRILAGYSPWGHKELDMNEHACLCVHPHTHTVF